MERETSSALALLVEELGLPQPGITSSPAFRRTMEAAAGVAAGAAMYAVTGSVQQAALTGLGVTVTVGRSDRAGMTRVELARAALQSDSDAWSRTRMSRTVRTLLSNAEEHSGPEGRKAMAQAIWDSPTVLEAIKKASSRDTPRADAEIAMGSMRLLLERHLPFENRSDANEFWEKLLTQARSLN